MSASRKQSASRTDAAPEKIPSIKLSGLWFSPAAARKAKKAAAPAKPAPKAKSAAKPAPKPKAPAKPAPKAKPAAKPTPKPKAPAKPAPKAKPAAKPAPKPKAPAKPAPKAKPAAKPAPKPKAPAKPAPRAKPAAKPAPKPKAPAKPASKAKPAAKPAPKKIQSKVKTIPSGKSATKAEAAAEPAKAKVEPKPFNPDDVPDFGDDFDQAPPPDDTPFTDEELARFRDNLRELRSKLSGKAASLQSQSLHRYDEVNNAEDGTDAMTRNTELKKAALDEDQIKQIDAALVALGNGTYGFCQNCGRKIGTKRLLAIPFAKFCIQCQSDMEDEAARRGPAVDPDTATYED